MVLIEKRKHNLFPSMLPNSKIFDGVAGCKIIIGNKVILTAMMRILKTLQRELDNGKLKDIGQQNRQNIEPST